MPLVSLTPPQPVQQFPDVLQDLELERFLVYQQDGVSITECQNTVPIFQARHPDSLFLDIIKQVRGYDSPNFQGARIPLRSN